jgi:uncharacterized membrane protein
MAVLGIQIFDPDFDGLRLLFRWLHIVVGIAWIGLLYYFNFVQVPSFAQMDAGARNEAIDKLVTRALWWFRWAAVATLVTGLVMLGLLREGITSGDYSYGFDPDYWGSLQGTSIVGGGIIAIIMFLNVWLVIWPNQKVVIANARNVAAGGQADPNAPTAARKGLLASRTNALFSIPMVFFMTFTSHLAGTFDETSGRIGYWILFSVLVGLLEANALGLLGGTGQEPLRVYLETVPNVIIAGFVLWAVLYFVGWEELIGTP